MAKVALITGAGKGIGLEVARFLSSQGYDLIVASRNQAALNELAETCSTKVTVCPVDFMKPNSIDAVVAVAQSLPRLDLIFFSHGLHTRGSLDVLSDDDIMTMIQLHVTSIILLTKRLLPLVRQSAQQYPQDNQSIIFMSSGAAKFFEADDSVYVAAKHAAYGFAGSLFLEEREHGIKVCSVCPGFIDSKQHVHPNLELNQDKMIRISDIVDAVSYILSVSPLVCPYVIDLMPQYTPVLSVKQRAVK